MTSPRTRRSTSPVTLRVGRLEVEAEVMRRSLSRFLRGAWHVLEPRTEYVPGWHLDAICEHLEAVSNGQIQRLLINVPPKSTKSVAVSVMWPCWAWTQHPWTRWLFTSYTEQLSTRDSLKCRRLIQSPWYQARWGGSFQLTGDQNEKRRFENDHLGFRIATSLGGAATGEGGDFIVCDDPHSALEALSDTKRKAAIVSWDETMSTRANDPERSAFVIVMQRLHEQDLSGHVLEQGGYEHLCLPMEAEPKCVVEVKHPCTLQGGTSIGFKDKRKPGELLSPKRFSRAAVDDLAQRLGTYAAAGQLQQRPAPRGGGLFQIEGLRVVKAPPSPIVQSVRSWDKAGTEGGGDYSVGAKVAKLEDGTYLVQDVVRFQKSAGAREAIIVQTAASDGPEVRIKIEQEPGSGGKESAEASVRRLAGYVVEVHKPTGDKIVRAEPFAVQVEAGNVALLRAEWNAAFSAELGSFPAGAHDDQVDAAAAAFTSLAGAQRLEIF